jgi:hypothetical protein
MKRSLFALTALLSATSGWSATLDLAFSDHTARLAYRSESNDNASKREAAWLHHEENGDVFSYGYHMTHHSGNFSGGLGGKLFILDADGSDVHGLAVGGSLAYQLNTQFHLETNIHYAPSVTTFNDGENYSEWDIRALFNVMPNTGLFLGFRDVDVDFKRAGKAEIHRGGFAGFAVKF